MAKEKWVKEWLRIAKKDLKEEETEEKLNEVKKLFGLIEAKII